MAGTDRRGSSRTELRRLDLPRRNAESLSFSGHLELDEKLRAIFADSKELGPIFYDGGTHYSRSSQRHHVMGLIMSRQIDSPELWFHVRYDISGDFPSSLQYPGDMQRWRAFFDRLMLLPGPHALQVNAKFTFPEEVAKHLWFPLPTRLSGAPDDSITYEVRGVEGARLNSSEPDKTDFSFNLRRSKSGPVGVEIRFSVISEINERLPEELLTIATKHAKALVGS